MEDFSIKLIKNIVPNVCSGTGYMKSAKYEIKINERSTIICVDYWYMSDSDIKRDFLKELNKSCILKGQSIDFIQKLCNEFLKKIHQDLKF